MKQVPKSLAPIVLFVYNRPLHTHKTIQSLKKNVLAAQSELFVFADGPRGAKDRDGVTAVRALIRTIKGFKKSIIREGSTNCGLAASVIQGVSEVIDRYGQAIVIEDDLKFSPQFLRYMNEALNRYAQDPRIFSIGGYSPPLAMPARYAEDSYLSYRCCTWGWATWRDRWQKVDWEVRDFDAFSKDQEMINRFNRGGADMLEILKLQQAGKVSSWGIRWDYAHFKNEAYCFRPVRSLVQNTGNDGSGVHCSPTNRFDVALSTQADFRFPDPGRLQLDDEINRRFATFYDGRPRTGRVSLVRRLMTWARSRTPA